jgi:hypothetical protein
MKTSGTELETLDDTTTQEEYKEASSASRARNLAVELSKEKKRLKEELAELQQANEELTPTTPTGTIDSYVKWIATIFGVVGVFIMSAGFVTLGQVCYASAACCWIYVGQCWNDKAIMIGSAISATAVMMNLVQGIINL